MKALNLLDRIIEEQRLRISDPSERNRFNRHWQDAKAEILYSVRDDINKEVMAYEADYKKRCDQIINKMSEVKYEINEYRERKLYLLIENIKLRKELEDLSFLGKLKKFFHVKRL